MKPLTPGEILDIAGLRLTKPQYARARAVLEAAGYRCEKRPDGSILAWLESDIQEQGIPNYAAAKTPVKH